MTDSLPHADSTRNRSDTRSNSNQHSRRGSTSINPGVHSWVLSNQQNPPPPPPEHGATPLRVSRPLPDHTYHANAMPSQGHLPHRPLQVMNPTESEGHSDLYYPGADQARFGNSYVADNLEGRQRNPARTPKVMTRVPQDETRSTSFVGGFVRGLKNFPMRVLRNRTSTEKRRPAFITEEGESTEAVTTLPRYRSNPSTPIVGPSTVAYVQATEMPTPELHHDRLPTEALRSVRPRHPSYRVMPPSPNGFVEEQTAQIYDLPPPEPPTFLETPPSPSPQPEADQATALYYDTPADGTSFNGQPQSQSLRISYISHPTPNTRATTLNPATPQHIPSQIPSQIPSDIQENPTSVQSPVLARPPLSNDYRKMSLNSHDATSRTDTHTTSYSMEPSFSSELSPVKRFLHILHSLPWVAGERITSDYNPGGGSEKDSPKKKPMISWYRRAEDSHGNTAAVDLLSAGSPRSEGANSSAATPPKLEPRRVRRSHSHLHTQRHQHGHSRHQRHHRQHHHRHGHGRKNQRRRTATTAETDDDDDDDDDDVVHHVHDPSSVLPSVYPSQYTYAYPYPFPPPTAPRGPRSRPSPTYHGGYVPFQPMPPTPPPAQMPVASPVYVFAPNGHSQENMLRDGYPVQGQQMYVLPNGYHHHNQVSMSPPPNMDSTP